MTIALGFNAFDWIYSHLPEFIRTFVPKTLIDPLKARVDKAQVDLEAKLTDVVNRIIGPLRPVITILTQLKDNTIGVLESGNALVKNVEFEYEKIRTFKINPHWRGRVTSVPDTVRKIQSLANIPHKTAGVIKDLIEQVKGRLNISTAVEDATEAVKGLEGFEDLQGVVKRFVPKLGKGIEKSLGILALIVDTLVTIRQVIRDLETIVDEVREVRGDIENLDLIFLRQDHPRRFLTLADGRKIRIREGGHLHPFDFQKK
jgi:hypothetical protein